MIDAIHFRTKGEFPLSIGTSIAIECLLGVNKERTDKSRATPPFNDYQHICINIATISRNIISAIKTDQLDSINERKIKDVIIAEINIIKMLLEEYCGNRISYSFYYNNYKKLNRVLRGGRFKKDYTNKQLYQYLLEKRSCETISTSDVPELIKTDLDIFIGKRRTIMLTHQPVDLLLFKNGVVELLESHTGRIKKSNEFNTKLKYGGDDVPFNKVTLQIFGDKNGFILPESSKTRNAVLEAFKKAGINKFTTDEKIMLKKLRETRISEAISAVVKLV